MAGLFDDEVVTMYLRNLVFRLSPDYLEGYYSINFRALELKCPLDNGKHQNDFNLQYSAKTATMRHFDILPAELRNAVFLELDIQNLTTLRAVNRYTRSMVDAHPQYHAIITYAPRVLRAVLSVGVAQHITCAVLFTSLCTSRCVKCGDFGPYMYLLTGSRVCYFCMTEEDEFLPFKPMHARLAFGLDTATLSSLPRMKILAGRYPGRGNGARTSLIDSQTAREAGITLHSSAHMMDQYAESNRAGAQADYQDRLTEYQRTLKGKKPPPSCAQQLS
ncbi:hypothetical protein MMC18_003331 [Xylographa bjoerkii]|nr:hypothetical protein [Xylographa bjoerkii]